MSYLLQRRHSSFYCSQECSAVGIEIAQAHRHELVVQGSIMRDFHTDIIGSEAVHRQSGFGTFQQHRHRLPDMARIKKHGVFSSESSSNCWLLRCFSSGATTWSIFKACVPGRSE